MVLHRSRAGQLLAIFLFHCCFLVGPSNAFSSLSLSSFSSSSSSVVRAVSPRRRHGWRCILPLTATVSSTTRTTTTTTAAAAAAAAARRYVSFSRQHTRGGSRSRCRRHQETRMRTSLKMISSSSSSSSLSHNQTVSSALLPEEGTATAAAAIVVDITTDTSSSSSSSSSSSFISSSVSSKNNNNIPFPILLWRFARPHTLIGSALAIPSLHFLAAPSWSAALLNPRTWYSIVACLIPSLLMNLYITGLNQITDVDIDRINKPNLVVAAGLLRKSTATVIVITALLLSLSLGQFNLLFAGRRLLPWSMTTPGLKLCLWGSAILGTLYSLPPVRLKRFPALAAFCIVAVRGTIINAGFFAHAQAAVYQPATAWSWRSVGHVLAHSPHCFWSSLFFAVFGMVIAFMKDVPDVLGDRLSDIRTLSVRWGPAKVFQWSHRLLTTLFTVVGVRLLLVPLVTTLFGSMMMLPTLSSLTFSWGRAMAGLASLVAAWSVQHQARTVSPESSTQVYQYYMHLWKLFYLSYLILPLAR